MAEYIEREAAVEALDVAERFLRRINAADVVPVVRGRWVAEEQKVWNLEIPVVIGWSCSVCAEEGYIDFNYCPNCGARMDGDEDG